MVVSLSNSFLVQWNYILYEMLIWNARTGIIYEVVTRLNGELICVYGNGTYAEDDHTVSLYLCEGNALEKDCANLQGKQLNEYYQLQDHQLVMVPYCWRWVCR